MQTEEKKSIHSHKDLVVWQKSMQLVIKVYRASDPFPENEKFGLTAQIRRAAVSIPSNIAEGRSRGSRKDFAQFGHIALGSSAELETQLEIAHKLSYLQKVDYNELMRLLEEVSKMLRKMIFSLKAST